MITFYQCLQEYYQNEKAIRFGKKRLHTISSVVAFLYNNNKNKEPIELVESVEENGTFMVRAYPDWFKKTINDVIWDHRRRMKKHFELEAQKQAKKNNVSVLPGKPAEEAVKPVEPVKRKRKRIPLNIDGSIKKQ